MAHSKRYSVSTYLTLGILAMGAQGALAADAQYCASYSDKIESSFSAAINAEKTKQFIHDRLYTTCLAKEGQPALPTTIYEVIDAIRTDAHTGVSNACPTPNSVTKTITIVRAPEQVLCSTHKMHTVYSGTSWHCAH